MIRHYARIAWALIRSLWRHWSLYGVKYWAEQEIERRAIKRRAEALNRMQQAGQEAERGEDE